MQSNKTRILHISKVFNGCDRTQREYTKSGRYFATKMHEWFVFVKDKGPEFEPKSEEQLNLF